MEKLSKFQKAALVWLDKHPNKSLVDCKSVELVEICSEVRPVPLGNYLYRIKKIYRAMQRGEKYGTCKSLKEEEITWWRNHGFDLNCIKTKREVYQEGALLWLKTNPGKGLNDCARNEEVYLPSGVCHIGSYLHRIQGIYRAMQKGKKYCRCSDLTEEEILWWSALGFIWDKPLKRSREDSNSNKKMMEVCLKYQEAALVWLKQNPDKTLKNCKGDVRVALESGEEIDLGLYLNRLRFKYNANKKDGKFSGSFDLNKESIAWWDAHGMVWKKREYHQDYRKAALLWLEKNPNKTLADCGQREIVTFETGKVCNLGCYVYRIQNIYLAMQRGEKFRKYRNLTEEEILWWSEHGMNWGESNFLLIDSSKKKIHHDIEKYISSKPVEKWIEEAYLETIQIFEKEGVFTCSGPAFEEVMERVFENYLFTFQEKKRFYQYLREYFRQMKAVYVLEVGLIEQEHAKLEKIQKYGLDEYDIEESFFVSYEQEKDVDLKKKYELLKNYIIDWNYYSEEEQLEIQRQNGFSDEDMKYVNSMRKGIDEFIQKVKELRR